MTTIRIRVLFADARFNFVTGINTTLEGARTYYVGQLFNMGLTSDNMQKCIDVELISE